MPEEPSSEPVYVNPSTLTIPSISSPDVMSSSSISVGPDVTVDTQSGTEEHVQRDGSLSKSDDITSSAPNPRRSQGTGALEDDSMRNFMLRMDQYCQHLLDRIAPFKLYRWVGLTLLLVLFLLRMFILEGFYIIAYVLFIFILNQFILFLQPKDRAALVARAASSANGDTTATPDETEEDVALPTLDGEEFRPFVRRLPEFKFWYSTTYATILAFCATFFEAFDIPVFWPLLLFYFVLLFVATMRKQWLDMKRLRYVPWDIGSKKVYKSDPKRVSVARSSRPLSSENVVTASGCAPPLVPTISVNPKSSSASLSSSKPL